METRDVFTRARKKAKVSQTDLAIKLGLSQSYICDVERGRRPVIEKWAVKLPDELRKPVLRALIREHRDAISRLRAAV